MARKFINASTSLNSNCDVTIVAVCDDGTLWTSFNNSSFQYFGVAPQDGEISAPDTIKQDGHIAKSSKPEYCPNCKGAGKAPSKRYPRELWPCPVCGGFGKL